MYNYEDEDEQEVVKQFSQVEGGNEFVEMLIEESVINTQSHYVDATISLNNNEAYVEILNED